MDEKKIDYGIHEDCRFPVNLMHKAYWVLEHHGYTSFRKYVDRLNMPNQDIERVLNKYKYHTDPEFRTEIKEKLRNIQKEFEQSDFELEKEIPF